MEKAIMAFTQDELVCILLACRRSYNQIAKARKDFDKYPSYRDTLIANANREQDSLERIMIRLSSMLKDIQND